MTRRSALILSASLLALGGCELGWKVSEQAGYRGTGTAQISDLDNLKPAANIPEPLIPLDQSGPRAGSIYPGLQELGGLSESEFNRLMSSFNQWVAPAAEGCNYCHVPENMASDEKYQFKVARQMIRMTRNINGAWGSHVQQTGVTCYTCHRGNAVPEYVWTLATPRFGGSTIRGNDNGQNRPDPNVGYSSLPFDPFARYLEGQVGEVRVASSSPFPSRSHKVSIQETEGSYGLMMHLSSALGVNCTYCHNSQSFRSWGASTQQRGTAFYGIRMVRDINERHITPLTPVFPANRLGAAGDPYKVNCATCHQGQAKPLGGAPMLRDHPALGNARVAATPPVTNEAPPAPPAATPGVTPAAPAAN